MTAASHKQPVLTASRGIFKPRRLGHVVFWVRNYKESADFYTSIVGIEEVYRREAIKAIFMSNGNTYHDLAFMDLDTPRGAGHEVGLHHFSLELESEAALVEGYKAAEKAGFAFDFTISADVTNSCYGSDPDGNRFEVYADVKENWRTERQGAVSTGAAPYVPGATPPIEKSLYPVNPEIVAVPDAVFHPRRASHAVLVARDYDAMLRHYVHLAGLTILAGGPDHAFVVLGGSLGEETLSLFRSGLARKPGLHHFGLELENEREMDASLDRLQARGLKPVAEISHETRRSVFFADLNGFLVQFYVNRAIDYASWSDLPDDLALFIA